MADVGSVKGFEWQKSVWGKSADRYEEEIDFRFVPVIEHVISRANLQEGDRALDLGSGTGAVSFVAAKEVGSSGKITAVDICSEMLAKVREGAEARSLKNIEISEGRGEAIPSPDESYDVVLASLSLMYVIDRAECAREIARVLRPGGRLVAAVWGGAEKTDIVKFQQIAGSFAPTPPVKGVGPGSMADPAPFLDQLSNAGLQPSVETEVTCFKFDSFDSAWETLAFVTTSDLEESIQNKAKAAACEHMWDNGDGPREFSNLTQFIIATKPS